MSRQGGEPLVPVLPDVNQKADIKFLTSDPWRIVYFRQNLGNEVLIADGAFWFVKAVEPYEPGIAMITLAYGGSFPSSEVLSG